MWIPAIDLSQGQSVRLYQGDFEQKTIINSNPDSNPYLTLSFCHCIAVSIPLNLSGLKS